MFTVLYRLIWQHTVCQRLLCIYGSSRSTKTAGPEKGGGYHFTGHINLRFALQVFTAAITPRKVHGIGTEQSTMSEPESARARQVEQLTAAFGVEAVS